MAPQTDNMKADVNTIRHLGRTKGATLDDMPRYLSSNQLRTVGSDLKNIKSCPQNSADKGLLWKLGDGKYKINETTRRGRSRRKSSSRKATPRRRSKSRKRSDSKKRKRSSSGKRRRKRSGSGKRRKRSSTERKRKSSSGGGKRKRSPSRRARRRKKISVFSKHSSSMITERQIPPKKAKRKRILSEGAVMKVTSYVIKKFSEIIIEDDGDLMPFKKIKIFEDEINESLGAGDVKLFLTDSLPNLTWSENVFAQNEFVKKSPFLHETNLQKQDCSKQLISIKKKSHEKSIEQSSITKNKSPEKIVKEPSISKKNSPEKSDKTLSSKFQLLNYTLKRPRAFKMSPIFSAFLIPTMLPSQIQRFENCVNFIRPSRLPSVVDIDNIVRSFSMFGKVVGIQDHWAEPKGSWNQYASVWLGATVTYKYAEDLKRVVKAFSLEKASVICVPMLEHLSQISRVESEYIHRHENTKFNGTSILVENIYPGVSRDKLLAEFECYGSVSEVKWIKLNYMKRACEVTYFLTTNAVAAALALNGKKMQRFILRAKIKMTSKEVFIHRKLCEMS